MAPKLAVFIGFSNLETKYTLTNKRSLLFFNPSLSIQPVGWFPYVNPPSFSFAISSQFGNPSIVFFFPSKFSFLVALCNLSGGNKNILKRSLCRSLWILAYLNTDPQGIVISSEISCWDKGRTKAGASSSRRSLSWWTPYKSVNLWDHLAGRLTLGNDGYWLAGHARTA